MNGVALARDLVRLGAESALAIPGDQIPDVHDGFAAHAERWDALRAQIATYEAEGSALWTRLHDELGLSRAGAWLVLLTVATELHPDAAAAASLLAEDDRVHLITPLVFARLARTALEVPFVDAVAEAIDGRVQLLALIESVDSVAGRPVAQHGLRLPRRELAALLAEPSQIGVQVAAVVRHEEPSAAPVFDRLRVRRTADLLAERGVLGLRATSPRAARQLALDVAGALGMPAAILPVGDELPTPSDVARLPRGLRVLDFSYASVTAAVRDAYLLRLRRDGAPVIALVTARASTSVPTLEVPPLTAEQSRTVWGQIAPDAAGFLSRRFRIGVDEARAAVREAADSRRVDGDGGAPVGPDIAAAVRAQGERRMGKLVDTARSRARFRDLVVPPTLREQIEEIIAWYQASERAFAGLDLRTDLGRGLTCLFSGGPGTGKTFAAQCIANELELNLYRIDLSQVVSKYIGDTEKALSQVFDEAEAGHGVLLFDEADALFGRRTEVKDAHDRYANVEVGYLLQRLEQFDGVAILTTNLRNNIDSAFVRRLRFVLEFPLPDAEHRRDLWRRSLPPSLARAEDVDVNAFADRFRLSGSNIHNIGLAAAHLAAASPDGRITAAHVARATFRELEKSGLPRSPSDFGALASLLPEAQA